MLEKLKNLTPSPLVVCLGIALGILTARTWSLGTAALAHGDYAHKLGDNHEAIWWWRRAARAYVPFLPHVGAAYERLHTMAQAADAQGKAELALAAWTGWGGLFGLAMPLILFCSASGFIVANSLAGALAGFPERAGAVSALVGSIHYGSGIIGSALVGVFADGTPWPMGCVIAFAGIGSAACALLSGPIRT